MYVFLSLHSHHSVPSHTQDDIDGQLVALNILSELMSKLPGAFGEQFTRLGLPMHIANLASTAPATDRNKEDTGDGRLGKGEAAEAIDGARETSGSAASKQEQVSYSLVN